MVLKNILLTGGSGRLGSFIRKNIRKEYNLYSPLSSEMNILKNLDISTFLNKNKVEMILHCAAFTDVKAAEKKFLEASEINVIGTLNLLKEAVERDIDFVFISTDAVFDGKKGNYQPLDPVNPQNKYAKTKTAAELLVRNYEKSVIIRTAFFEYDFPYDIAFYDQYTSKDYIDIIGPKILNVISNYEYGIYHVGSNKKSMYDIAKQRKSEVKKASKKDFNFKIVDDSSFDLEVNYGKL